MPSHTNHHSMKCLLSERFPGTPWKIGALALLTLFLAAFSIFCLTSNTQVLFPHLYYIPIIIAAFWFQRKGILFAIALALFYLWAVFTFSTPDIQAILAAVGRAFFFVGVSIVIAILSLLIHAQKDEISQSEERFHGIWDHIQAGIILVDPETRTIMAANPEAQRITGYSEEQMKGQKCHRFICPAEEGNCPVCDKGQTVDRADRVVLTRDGKEIHVLKTVTDLSIGGKRCLVESFIDLATGKKI